MLLLVVCASVLSSGCAPQASQGSQSYASGYTAAASSAPSAYQSEQSAASTAAEQQVAEATQGIGNEEQVREASKRAADALKGLLTLEAKLPNVKQQVVLVLTQNVAQLSSGLDAVAQSQSDQQFVRAMLSMCDRSRVSAASQMGPFLVALAANIRAKPPRNVPTSEWKAWADYYDSLGESLVQVPSQCEQIQAAIAEARAKAEQEAQNRMVEAQNQRRIEAENEMIAAQQRQQKADALMRLGIFLLTPPANRTFVGF